MSSTEIAVTLSSTCGCACLIVGFFAVAIIGLSLWNRSRAEG